MIRPGFTGDAHRHAARASRASRASRTHVLKDAKRKIAIVLSTKKSVLFKYDVLMVFIIKIETGLQ